MPHSSAHAKNEIFGSLGKMFSSSCFTLITITTILIILPSLSSAATNAQTRRRPFSKIYAFGDSFTDTGNTKSTSGPNGFRYVSNPPYGMTFFHRPTNRYSDGRLVIDFVAQALSLPYLPPYLNSKADLSNGVNFAVAGSTAINYDFFVKNNLTLDITPQSIQTELLWFNKFLESQGCKGEMTRRECNQVFNDALIWVGEIGVNDYAYTIGSSVTSTTIQALAIKSHTGFLEAILKKGAKYVLVQGLPPTGCLPLAMTLAPENDRDDIGCVGSVNKQTYNHNTVLQTKLQSLRVQFPQAVILYADYWNVYHTIMKNAKKYGFKEPFKACCGSGEEPYNFNVFTACGSPNTTSCANPSLYINWDGVHLTEAMYKVVSYMFLHGNSCHPSFDYLLSKRQKVG